MEAMFKVLISNETPLILCAKIMPQLSKFKRRYLFTIM